MKYIGKHNDVVVDAFIFANVIKGDNEVFVERVKRLLNLNIMDIAQTKVIKVAWDEEIENIAAILGKSPSVICQDPK